MLKLTFLVNRQEVVKNMDVDKGYKTALHRHTTFCCFKLQEDFFAFLLLQKCNVNSHHNIIKLNNLKI